MLERREAWLITAALIVASLLSGLGASYPPNTWLQVGPVMIFAVMVPWLRNLFPLSRMTWFCGVAFLLLHLFAARWTYSNVPYEAWLGMVGIDAPGLFGSDRNMFDRLVHFTYGLLAVYPLIEMEVRWAGLPVKPARRVALLFVLASSAIYEIFEWSLAILMSPESAEAYNGQQGDAFDAQKDMLIAFVGAIVALPFVNRHLQKAA